MTIEFAAEKAHVKREQLSSWELGSERPSLPQLRKLAKLYRRPLATFYLEAPPTRFEAMHDFRRLSSKEPPIEGSPKLALEIRRAFDRRDWALELMENFDERPPEFKATASIEEAVEAVATRLRIAIGVTTENKQPGQTTTKPSGSGVRFSKKREFWYCRLPVFS